MRTRWRGIGSVGILVSLCATVVGCGPGLHFRRATILSAVHDPDTQATRVAMTFEVWDGEDQLTNLSRESFRVFEDDQPATSESLSEADTTEQRVPVVLVLDASLSMYQANAMGALESAASRFVQVLGSNGFDVTTYRFASQIEAIADPSTLPDTFDEAGGERWTSLYAAVAQAMRDHPEAIIVVFSDGADNYSQNHGVAGLGAVEAEVLPRYDGGSGRQRVVHTIGFGNVATERDRDGVPAIRALERLARNGSFHFAEQRGAFDAVFQDVADRIRNVYVYEYFSPNLRGAHMLQVEVNVDGRHARTERLMFVAGAASPAGSSGAPSDPRVTAAVAELARTLETQCPPGPRAATCLRDLMRVLLARANPGVLAVLTATSRSSARVAAALTALCEEGEARACRALGTGDTIVLPDDPRERVEMLRGLCERGDPRSVDADGIRGTVCIYVGLVLRDGLVAGVDVDHAAAYAAFRRGCENGEAEACVGAASMQARGWGTQADPAAASIVLRAQCEAGRFSACGYLGRLEVLGEGVPRDEAQGLRRLREACTQGHAASCRFLEEQRPAAPGS